MVPRAWRTVATWSTLIAQHGYQSPFVTARIL